MKRLLLSLLLGTSSLYLSIRWLPSENAINFSYYFAALIFNPIKFFLAAIAFLFAFLFFSTLVKSIIYELIALVKKNQTCSFPKLFVSSLLFFVPYLLKEYSFWTLTINLSLAFFYGIFTLDNVTKKSFDVDS